MGKTLKIKNLHEKINVAASLRLHGKSGAKNLKGKSIHEVKQYVGTKDLRVTSRIDILRGDNINKVLHRLWRDGKGWVHEHWK